MWDIKREKVNLLAIRRTKGLSNSGEEIASSRQAHPRQRQEAGERGKGQTQHRDGTPTKLQTGLQFLTKDFLRVWTVDSCREGRG